MLASAKMVGFIPTKDYDKARAFYEGKLGFEFVSLDKFALVMSAGGRMIRITKVPNFTPLQGTILGWQVENIQSVAIWLRDRGVQSVVAGPVGFGVSPTSAALLRGVSGAIGFHNLGEGLAELAAELAACPGPAYGIATKTNSISRCCCRRCGNISMSWVQSARARRTIITC